MSESAEAIAALKDLLGLYEKMIALRHRCQCAGDGSCGYCRAKAIEARGERSSEHASHPGTT